MSIFEKKELPYDLSNFTILIVEDSQYMQSLLVSMLNAFGVGDVLACDNATEAVDILKILQASRKSRHLQNIDIVLTDWLMPNGSGKDLLNWIRNNDKDSIRFLPVIVVSGYTTQYITTTARDLGAHETLTKPVSGMSLASRICSVIDNPRPFIKAARYFGPDRRRQDMPFPKPDRRVIQTEQIKVKHASIE